MTAKTRYEALVSYRSKYLTKADVSAKLTLPYLIREDVYDVSDIMRDCAMQGKKMKIHENIGNSEQLVKDNYKIMQLYYPNIRPINRAIIDKSIKDFEPFFSKIKFTQMLFEDDAGHLNFNDLQAVFRRINR